MLKVTGANLRTYRQSVPKIAYLSSDKTLTISALATYIWTQTPHLFRSLWNPGYLKIPQTYKPLTNSYAVYPMFLRLSHTYFKHLFSASIVPSNQIRFVLGKRFRLIDFSICLFITPGEGPEPPTCLNFFFYLFPN